MTLPRLYCTWMSQDTIPGEISPGVEENKEEM